MGALAEDRDLMALTALPTANRIIAAPAARSVSIVGLHSSEASQYLVLMADDPAIETGATIYGAVPGVYINADGYKEIDFITGIGNYLTFGPCLRSGRKIWQSRLTPKHIVACTWNGHPQNRVT